MIATTREATREDLALPGAEPPAIAGSAPGTIAWTPILIATEYCKGCSLCIGACEKHALALDETRVNVLGYHPVLLVDAGACTSCALCARVCPDCVLTVLAPPKGAKPATLAAAPLATLAAAPLAAAPRVATPKAQKPEGAAR
jgi:2-oxoglutarate ferredoxin oxidoreductase subunit delta